MIKTLSVLALTLASVSAMAADRVVLNFELVEDGLVTSSSASVTEGVARLKTGIDHSFSESVIQSAGTEPKIIKGKVFSGLEMECAAYYRSEGDILLRVKADHTQLLKMDQLLVDGQLLETPHTATRAFTQDRVVKSGTRTEFMSYVGKDGKKVELYVTATSLDANRG